MVDYSRFDHIDTSDSETWPKNGDGNAPRITHLQTAKEPDVPTVQLPSFGPIETSAAPSGPSCQCTLGHYILWRKKSFPPVVMDFFYIWNRTVYVCYFDLLYNFDIFVFGGQFWHFQFVHRTSFKVLEDLEDYFHRVDARRAEVEAEMAAEARQHHASRCCQKKGLASWITRWWFQIFFIFTPIWGRFPFWLTFFRWVETTNQIRVLPAWNNVFFWGDMVFRETATTARLPLG